MKESDKRNQKKENKLSSKKNLQGFGAREFGRSEFGIQVGFGQGLGHELRSELLSLSADPCYRDTNQSDFQY